MSDGGGAGWQLPTMREIAAKVGQSAQLSPLEAFIWDQCPARQYEWAFRESLHAAIMDAVAQITGAT